MAIKLPPLHVDNDGMMMLMIGEDNSDNNENIDNNDNERSDKHDYTIKK